MFKKTLMIIVVMLLAVGPARADQCSTDLPGWMKKAFCQQGGDGTGGDGGSDDGGSAGAGDNGGEGTGGEGTGGDGGNDGGDGSR